MSQINLFNTKTTPLVILAEGCFGEENTKIISALVRYGNWPIVAGLDSTRAGKTSKEILGYGVDFPIVSSIEEAMKYNPAAMLIGIAVQGGELPYEWRQIILNAIDNGLDIINGLHFFLNEDEEISKKAEEKGKILWDVREPLLPNRVCKNLPRPSKPKVVLTVGSDCSCGKMFTTLELEKTIKKSLFLATGQTGILISGSGIPLDRIIGDFMAGAAEHLVHSNLNENLDWLLVEGQGSLIHPSFSGVTMALMHGCAPDAMILCHTASRKYLKKFDIPIPSMNRLVEVYETAMGFIKPARVVGISLNCFDLDDDATDRILKETEDMTGLPTVEPLKTGVERLYESLVEELD
ncbi:MAG: DUF1611 domain-containing protein [Cyanobacteriota bacterium]